MARYRNPWYDRIEKAQARTGAAHRWYTPRDQYHVEFIETCAVPVEYGGCLIYERSEWGNAIFDVVLDGVCVAQRAGPNGARAAIDAREWEQRDWWNERQDWCKGLQDWWRGLQGKEQA